MFTGIVQALGRIVSVEPLRERGVRLRVQVPSDFLNDVGLGDSIAIQGACMTVVECAKDEFVVDVSAESLGKTVGLNAPGEVNLEKAVSLQTRLGGHLVSGHVDGLGRVAQFVPVAESWLLEIDVPPDLGKFFAYKGSVTVNGVSLTVNRVDDSPTGTRMAINLIPHTIAVTTLKDLRAGDAVNLEVDLIARYCERLLAHEKLHPERKA